jgi:hypothetical protein
MTAYGPDGVPGWVVAVAWAVLLDRAVGTGESVDVADGLGEVAEGLAAGGTVVTVACGEGMESVGKGVGVCTERRLHPARPNRQTNANANRFIVSSPCQNILAILTRN